MSAVPPLEAAHQPAEAPTKKAPKFNYYPLLGILLVLVTAILVYGGILLVVVDDWSFLQFGDT